MIHRDALALELSQRITSQFRLEDFCFAPQLKFIRDPSPYKTAVCSRRAGKTIACAADLIETALANPDRVCLYITLSRANAKRIVWPEILKINRDFHLGGRVDNTELSIRFPNGSVIYCSGAKDQTEIEKFRGLALTKVYVDESQSFRPYLEDLVNEVLSKALFDYNGTLCLIGTPGPVPIGYFYEASVKSKKWSHHSWTMMENPWLRAKSGRDPMELVHEDASRMGVTLDHPKIQRESFGRWVMDEETLVFKYDREKNGYSLLPDSKDKWEYVIGVDIGHDDADAIAVLGWHGKSPELYLVEEFLAPKQGITELAEAIEKRVKRYNPLKIVMDTGGLGKKIAVELQRRFALPVVAAEKSRKFEYIELLNDAFRTSRFFAKANSTFAQDCSLIEWDRDPEKPEKLHISERYHSDICDAVLYAFRESLHWTYVAETAPPMPGSHEWNAQEEQKLIERLEDQFVHKEVDIWDRALSNGENDDFFG